VIHGSVDILGVRVDDVSFADALAQVESFLREGSCRQIATVNPEFVVMAQRDATLGVGLLWAARRLGHPLRERVPGQEMVDRISARSAQCGDSIFLLGAREGIAERAAAELIRVHRGLVIAGCYSGSPAEEEEQDILGRVNDSGARVLFVAYGPPRQELWIARNAARLKVGVAMGVGGTFDTLAGIVPRAPRWMRRAGFEWTYRLLREPRRFKRQLSIPYFMWLIVTGGKRR
jgi:N-acetylglucosaminyldiphosphoundecaprenol N-acetyl-beta-D-mannosaminyltransferase